MGETSSHRTIWADQCLLPDGWARHVGIEINIEGRILSVCANQPASGYRVGILLPAPVNSHSHAFQRAMAGLTEQRSPNPVDSFWTWRQLMFRFLERIDPDQVQAIAAFVQMEMLEAGFSTNVEFHYLHHQPNGQPYDRLAEMAERVAAAAKQTGIGLTLLPVHYQFGGCDQRQLGPGQVRFGNDPDRFADLVHQAGLALRRLPSDSVLGVAPHSLRAVARESLSVASELVPNGPVHMHLAEQLAEVDEVQACWGARPVEWVLANLDLDARWCLIHCTQMLPSETVALAGTQVVAGLCPITEASLGDGTFDCVRWMANGGRISMGSDSNIKISLAQEICSLETSQRLRDHSRAALATSSQSTGRRLFQACARGGAQAAGRGHGIIDVGEWADLLALDDAHPDLNGLEGDFLLDSFIFAGGNRMVRDVWSAGRHLVQDGRHIERDLITREYVKYVQPLRAGL